MSQSATQQDRPNVQSLEQSCLVSFDCLEPTPKETYGTANQRNYTAGPLLLDKVLADAMQSHDDRVP